MNQRATPAGQSAVTDNGSQRADQGTTSNGMGTQGGSTEETPEPPRFEDLPDFPSLAQLRRSLHGVAGGRRAAVLVGAGFSRNAERAADDAPLAPLWNDFARAMQAQLDPSGPRRDDALRLAEEFRVVFGRSALEDLVRQLVPDETWVPGALHRRLLNLPWTDVLTTNWDTLLERAAADSRRRQYGVVRTIGDMASVRAPRVVKLHGSLPSHTPFILTQEDYRRYPSSHAAFVNLARQVFIENELVLLGFSGDDPNFLEWAGWVRDQLQDQGRRLYIVGVLAMAASRRQLLLNMNIVPIDLAALVHDVEADRRHEVATERLMSFLEEGAPRNVLEWPKVEGIRQMLAPPERVGPIEPVKAERAASRATLAWRGQRESYPGWLVCPQHNLILLRMEVDHTFMWFAETFTVLPQTLQLEALRELSWLSLTSGVDLPEQLIEVAHELMHHVGTSLMSSARMDIARALLQRARFREDDVEFQRCSLAIGRLGREGEMWRDFATATRSLHRLDFSAVEPLVRALRSDEPVWQMRRAGLCASLGDVEEARSLYGNALATLRERQAREPDSLWIRSRARWAEELALVWSDITEPGSENPYAALSSLHRESHEDDGCDVQRQFDRLRRSLEEDDHRRRTAIQRNVRFDPGVYLDEGRWNRLQSRPLTPQRQIRHVFDDLAITGLGGIVDFFRSFVRRFATTCVQPSDFEIDWLLFLADSTNELPLLEHYLNRGTVASLPAERVRVLTDRLLGIIDYGLARADEWGSRTARRAGSATRWISRLNSSFEALSRLALRCEREEATRLYNRGLEWSSRVALRHWWLHECFARLLSRLWSAVHPLDRAAFTVPHLLFPLPFETDDQRLHFWPEPLTFEGSFTRDFSDTRAERRIQQLIEWARAGTAPQRRNSLLRLQLAADHELLTELEAAAYAGAFWSKVDANGMPEETGMWTHVALTVPNPERPEVRENMRARWLSSPAPVRPFDRDWMHEVTFVCRDATNNGDALSAMPARQGPEAATAKSWLDYALSWPRGDDGATMLLQPRAEARRELGYFLQGSVYPFLDLETVDEALSDRLLSMADELPSTLPSLVILARRLPRLSARVLQRVRSALWNPDREFALQGASAAYLWLRNDPNDELGWAPLMMDVVALCGMARHPSSAWLWDCARCLVEKRRLDEGATERLLLALSTLQAATDVSLWDGLDPSWQEQAPLAMRAATRTALALRRNGTTSEVLDGWIRRLGVDPLPEVRYADLAVDDA